MALTKFQTGKTYFMRSPCNQDCIWTFEVISRTKKSVRLQEIVDGKNYGSQVTKRIKVFSDEETTMPLGSYSLAPMLKAGKIWN